MSRAAGSRSAHFADAGAALAALAALVQKERVGLGGLTAAQLTAVLGLAWCALPQGVELREADVNSALKRCLSEECSFLNVDHVELRRWLVDAGWLVRDGFGREYRRVAASGLPVESAQIAAALASVAPQPWVAGVRAAATAQRAARRDAWQARQGREGADPEKSPR